MKKLDFKSVILGFVIGTVGITTAFAAGSIKSATLSNAKVTLDGVSVPLDNSLVSITKDGEKDESLYMPLRELLEYIGYGVSWDGKNNTVNLTSMKNLQVPDKLATTKPIPETNTNTNNIYSNEPMRKYYDNDSEIIKATKNAFYENCFSMGSVKNSYELNFNLFVGCTSIYEFDTKEDTELTIEFQSDITEGKFKLVLVTADNKVITVSETVTPDNINVKKTLSLHKGKNALKIVGLDTSGNFVLVLSGDDALSYAKSLGI